MKQATYLTERHTSDWFIKRLARLFAAADIEVLTAPRWSPDCPGVVISGSWVIPEGVGKVAVIPFNEPLLPLDDDKSWKSQVRLFVSQAAHLNGHLLSKSMKPSAVVDHPLCWLPDNDINLINNRPIKFLVPRYGAWTNDDIARLIPYLIQSLSMDFGDLSGCEFIVECTPFHHQSLLGEKVTFYDDEGAFLHRLLRSAVVCCMGSASIMEMSFLEAHVGITGTSLFAEGLIDDDRRSTPESVFESISKPREYSHIKYMRAANGIIQLDDPEMKPMFTFCSGSGLSRTTCAMLQPKQMASMMRFAIHGMTAINEQALDVALQARRDNFKTMVEKIRIIYERLSS